MDDLISRQAAIDDVWNISKIVPTLAIRAKDALEAIPSAQQEIIRCKDCKWFGNIGCSIEIVDESDRPSENDFCSFAERKDNG